MDNQNNLNGQGFGVGSLVCGIVAIIIAFIPCVGMASMPFAIASIVFGAISMSRGRKTDSPKGMAVGGLVTSIIALVVSVAWLVALVRLSNVDGNAVKDKCEEIFNSMDWSMTVNECDADFDCNDSTMERLETVLSNMNNDANFNMTASDSTFEVTVDDGESKVTISGKSKNRK